MINYISGGARARTYVRVRARPRRFFLDASFRHAPPVHRGCDENCHKEQCTACLLHGGRVHGHGGGERHDERPLHEEELFTRVGHEDRDQHVEHDREHEGRGRRVRNIRRGVVHISQRLL